MRSLKLLFLAGLCSLGASPLYANVCCQHMGGVNYCDSSAGRLVCNNGFYSSCYCTPHAVMSLQLIQGCCLWHGGVLPVLDASGLVVCNDGFVSEECTLGNPIERISAW